MRFVYHLDCPVPRAWIRHPSGMAIDVRSRMEAEDWGRASEAPGLERLKDISLGGLACVSAHPYTVGEVVSISIPYTRPPFEVTACVVWCELIEGGYDLGVQFIHQDDAFAARMVEQVCHIEQYRQDLRETQGRDIDSETAAREWIEKFADIFPDPRGMH